VFPQSTSYLSTLHPAFVGPSYLFPPPSHAAASLPSFRASTSLPCFSCPQWSSSSPRRSGPTLPHVLIFFFSVGRFLPCSLRSPPRSPFRRGDAKQGKCPFSTLSAGLFLCWTKPNGSPSLFCRITDLPHRRRSFFFCVIFSRPMCSPPSVILFCDLSTFLIRLTVFLGDKLGFGDPYAVPLSCRTHSRLIHFSDQLRRCGIRRPSPRPPCSFLPSGSRCDLNPPPFSSAPMD